MHCDLLKFKTAWALAYIALGTSNQTKFVMKAGAVPNFAKLLSSPHHNVCDRLSELWQISLIKLHSVEIIKKQKLLTLTIELKLNHKNVVWWSGIKLEEGEGLNKIENIEHEDTDYWLDVLILNGT